MRKDTYTCAACGEKCISKWSEEEAVAEYEAEFGEPFDLDAVAEVCDDCYQRLMRLARETGADGRR